MTPAPPDDSSGEAGELLGETTEIYRTLRALQLSRSLVTLRIEGDSQIYSTMILLCDLDNRQFIMDAIRPESGNQRLQQGVSFALTGFYEGIQVVCKDNRISTTNPEQLDNAFSVPFPKFVYRKQRRQAYRTHLPGHLVREIHLSGQHREKPLTGQITDISSTGIGCEFSGNIKPELKTGEIFDNATININGELILSCCLIVRQPRHIARAEITQCGLAFDNLTGPEQKKVERYIAQLQRQARRRERES
ncbi:MAG: hypothetical protein AseanaTS_13540 [Candidatus Pelagadaptatus aseana]|uniref:flagellar brake protein n=1 Tax=Candidatus Pelagadaptatus aseana TaxID=3120508 RepID=UPI0039B203DC